MINAMQAAADRMGARITELLTASQSAGEQGNVDGAQAAAAQAEAVKVIVSHYSTAALHILMLMLQQISRKFA